MIGYDTIFKDNSSFWQITMKGLVYDKYCSKCQRPITNKIFSTFMEEILVGRYESKHNK